MVSNYAYVQRLLPQSKSELIRLLYDNFKDRDNFIVNIPSQRKRGYLESGNWCCCYTCKYLVKIDVIKKKTCPICGTYYRYTIRNKKIRKSAKNDIKIILVKREK